MLPTKQGQEEAEIEVQEIPPLQQEVQASPYAPKKRKIKTLVKRRQKMIKRVIPFPSVLASKVATNSNPPIEFD